LNQHGQNAEQEDRLLAEKSYGRVMIGIDDEMRPRNNDALSAAAPTGEREEINRYIFRVMRK
jgi:hypothetical protein